MTPTALGTLPPSRLERVDVAKLGDKDLEKGLHAPRSSPSATPSPLRREIVRRDSLAGQALQQEGFEWLARTATSFAAALAYISRGRQVAGAPSSKVCVSWDLLELSFRIGLHDGEGIMRLIQHIDKQHKREPEALQACVHMLIEAGLLHPDGTPVQGPGDGSPAAAESPAAESSGLWTPDSRQARRGGKNLDARLKKRMKAEG